MAVIPRCFRPTTLTKIYSQFLSHWMGYDRGDSFPVDFVNRMKFHLVQNRKENCHHDHIALNVKGNVCMVFSVHSHQLCAPTHSQIFSQFRWIKLNLDCSLQFSMIYFSTKWNSVWCQINRKSIDTIRIWFNLIRFREDVCVRNRMNFKNKHTHSNYSQINPDKLTLFKWRYFDKDSCENIFGKAATCYDINNWLQRV